MIVVMDIVIQCQDKIIHTFELLTVKHLNF